MIETFARHGVQFQYPESWELTEQPHEDGVAITVAGPGTSFWTLQLFFDRPPPAGVLKQAVDAFRDEYGDIDFYPLEDEVCDVPACGGDIDFVCLELINSAFVRAFQTEQFTALLLFQGTDHELRQTRDMLEAIAASLRCEDDGSDEGWEESAK